MKSLILVFVLTAVPAAAEVVDSTANGFAVRNTAQMTGRPE